MRLFVLFALVVMLYGAPAHAGTPLPDGPHVVATGEGRSRAKPDSARTSLAVSVRDADAAVVKQRVDAAVNAYLSALQQRGIGRDDVSASALSINEDFEYADGKRTSRGFRGSRNVDVRVRELKSLNDIIDAGLRAGMNEVGAIRFESTREDALKLEARQQAAADSRKRAEQLAQAFGARLGRIYSIDSVGSGVTNRYGASLDRIVVTGSAAPPAPGQYIEPSIDFNERVQVVFEIIP